MGEEEDLGDKQHTKRKRKLFRNECPPTDKSELQNEGDDGATKKPRVGDSANPAHLAGLETDSSPSFSFPSAPAKGAQDISGAAETKTPTFTPGKFNQYSLTPSKSPSSELFPQTSMDSTAFAPLALVPSPANEDSTARNPREYVNQGDQLDTVIVRRLFGHNTTKDIVHNLKINLGPVLIRRLKELSPEKPTIDVGMEMADSAYLLKLLYPSNPKLETAGEKARKGAMKLQEGMRLIAEGQLVLRSAIPESESLD